jgi:hypothetical protein
MLHPSEEVDDPIETPLAGLALQQGALGSFACDPQLEGIGSAELGDSTQQNVHALDGNETPGAENAKRPARGRGSALAEIEGIEIDGEGQRLDPLRRAAVLPQALRHAGT